MATKQNWFIKHLKFNQEKLYPVLLLLLLAVVIFQTFELSLFKSQIESQVLRPAASAVEPAGGLEYLPDMAGGC